MLVVVLFSVFGLSAASTAYALLEIRLYEGYRDAQKDSDFIVQTLEFDPQSARERLDEENSLRDIFQLKRVEYRLALELWLPELLRQPQWQRVSIHDRLLTLASEPLAGAQDRFRLVVSVEPPEEPLREVLLDTVVVLPQQKRAVLGFRDKARRIYFISLGRGKNIEMGYDRIIEGKAVRMPRLLVNVSPDYPLSALKQKIEGMVVVEGSTDSRGNVVSASVLTGPAELETAVVAAVRQWIYRPFTIDGVDEPIRFLAVCHFFVLQAGQAPPTREVLAERFDRFWDKHDKSPWPDPSVKGPVSRGINQRLVEMVVIEGRRE